ncbi:uncharacterized protein LOC143275238 [Babylonia areolata]|uniref:uncharacterized protein LOC143275238 n=1 Tax=Babylonia areolata TaxID=304850 RepID=UPI003FD15062
MAMYCVLPLIVLVYGGCSAIYCVHKCHRYFRRRRHKHRHSDTESLVAEDEGNDLNQEGGDSLTGSDRQPIKTVSSSSNWDDVTADVNGYSMHRKKTPLPWDNTPHLIPLQEKDSARSREANYSSCRSGESSSADTSGGKGEKEMETNMDDSPPATPGEETMRTNPLPPPPTATTTTTTISNLPPLPPPPPPPPTATTTHNNNNHHLNNFNHHPRPIQIIPISAKEYRQHVTIEPRDSPWDPLHHRPFESRPGGERGGGGGEGGIEETAERRGGGRESAWSIRDEIMAKYDALTSLAMAKRTAEVLRFKATTSSDAAAAANNSSSSTSSLSAGDVGGGGHRPDTLRRKKKKKMVFIAE